MMTYYIDPIWFYLMGVAIELKPFLYLVGVCLTFVFGLALISNEDSNKNEIKIFKKFKKRMITGIVLIFIGISLPSKETCVEMMVASQVTHENVMATKEEIYEIVDYVTDKVKGEE